MQRCSTSVGALAAALAKAQAEIANPEKSLTATIVSPFPREAARTFRYAPLSSGLDLVRKCLGQHEIATIQATTIDRDSGLIRLTTTLVHASGEWVSSDWPVCPISETAAPQRLGAALTYARRYALFTLVGIAGEDDVDAPDLPKAVASSSQSDALSPNKDAGTALSSRPNARLAADMRNPQRPLSPEASETLRRELICELEQVQNSEALASWAQQALPRKNQLLTADAQAVEIAFTAALNKLGEFESGAEKVQQANGHAGQHDGETVTVISKPRRERDREHLKFVFSQPCLICGRAPSDAHHVKFAEPRAMGRKVSDRFAVPVCRLHHHELHRRGNERVWWEDRGIDPLVAAAILWEKSRAVAPDQFPDERPACAGTGKQTGKQGSCERCNGTESLPKELARPTDH